MNMSISKFIQHMLKDTPLGPGGVGLGEVGPGGVGAAELGPAEVGAAELGLGEVGAAEVGAAEVGLFQRRDFLTARSSPIPLLDSTFLEECQGFVSVHDVGTFLEQLDSTDPASPLRPCKP
jgi:hypothetical protein